MRRITYVTGTRADFGLIERTLQLIHCDPNLEVSICVTGMHLLSRYGSTVNDIEASGIPIRARVPVDLDGTGGAMIARAIGHVTIGITTALEADPPDLIMVLGDRGEMLAAAVAGLHLNVPVVHLHGGERSGTLDEPVRHAISKLAHYHFVATEGSRERLLHMGEQPNRVVVVGAPGLDGLAELVEMSRKQLFRRERFDAGRATALVVFHPVHQEAQDAGAQMIEVMEAVLSEGLQVLCLRPNADAGGAIIESALADYERHPDVRVRVHLPRNVYVSWMAAVDALIGNSSSGIIEAASLQVPVVNIGSRQMLRERNSNVVDVANERAAIREGIRRALSLRGPWTNVYGDGHASGRIVAALKALSLDKAVLRKENAY